MSYRASYIRCRRYYSQTACGHERHSIDPKCGLVIDHHCRRVQLPHRIKSGVNIFGQNGRLKGIGQRVCFPVGVLNRVVFMDTCDRAENFGSPYSSRESRSAAHATESVINSIRNVTFCPVRANKYRQAQTRGPFGESAKWAIDCSYEELQ